MVLVKNPEASPDVFIEKVPDLSIWILTGFVSDVFANVKIAYPVTSAVDVMVSANVAELVKVMKKRTNEAEAIFERPVKIYDMSSSFLGSHWL